VTDAESIDLHTGRYQALATLARRGEWATVRSLLAAADPGDAATYRAWLAADGLTDPDENHHG